MHFRVKVSSKHQIAVPAAARRQLAIDAGDHLLVEIRDGVIILIPESIDPIDELKGLGGELWDGIDVEDYIDEERDGW